MNNLYPTLLVLALIAINASCIEEPQPYHEKLTIDFTVFSGHDIITTLPDNSRLIVNVQRQNGDAIMTYEEVTFALGKNSFYTSPLDLDPGSFKITDFMIVNAADEVLYATPRTGASLAGSVDHPLDYDFNLSAGAHDGVHLRLLDVRDHEPRDFGYPSFRKPGRGLNVFVTVKGQLKPTSADAFIVVGQDTVADYTLHPKMNQIPLPETMNENYRLVIAKGGYAAVHYTLSEVIRTHDNKPLQAELAPAFSMLAYVDATVSVFDFYLGGPEGSSIDVDWGDGTRASYQLVPGEVNITHTYATGGNYPVTITGDIDKITSFYSFYGQAMIDAVDFRQLLRLEEIRFGLTRSPAVLDLSHNTRLTYALLSGLEKMRILRLPEEHNITYLGLEGPNHLSTENIDAVLLSLYENAVKKELRNGTIGLAASWLQEQNDKTLAGPPSAQGLNHLRLLKESYGWTIFPDPLD